MTAPHRALSAQNIAAEIAGGRMTAQEALDQCKVSIDRDESTIQAFTHQPSKLLPGKGSLAGIAVGIKDVFDTYDMPTGYGSAIYENHKPVADASVVSMLRRAGATIAGKTVTTEFAWFAPGPTRNPHNPAHTPGGSSSGSAAGVAAGFFPAAIGTQTGGSIIRPAAFCGVAGYKPSFRLFPTIGMKQFSWSLDTVGFFAASVADAAFVAAACSGRDLGVDQADQTVPRFGIYRSPIDDQMAPDMADALQKATSIAKEAGASVTDVVPPEPLEKARDAHAPIQDFEAALSLADEHMRSPALLSAKLRDHLDAAAHITPETYDNARRTANHARKASRDLFSTCDALLLPSAPGTAPETLASTGDSVFNRLWTLLGMPCVSVAGLTGDNGLPLGLQIIAPFGQDKRALQAAHWLEKQICLNA